jgi:hypothetical protein
MMPAPTVRATSWGHLQDELLREAWDPELHRHRSRFVFRGMSRAGDAPACSLMQLGGPYTWLEAHLIRNFRKYAPHASVQEDTVWHWMVLGQHHGLPTRLVDWTWSPMVALHFATQDPACMSDDGVVWAVHVDDAMGLSPDPIRRVWRRQGSLALDIETLASAIPSLEEMAAMAADPWAVFFEPPSLDARIVNQYAVFSALSDPTLTMGAWLERPDVHAAVRARRVILPASLKWEVRDKLDQSNMTERVLMPGLDGLCRWLRRYYGRRTG